MGPATTEATISNRGRGPEIAGTRITVYDVMDYLKEGWHRDRIASLFRLSSRDIQVAIDYIAEHGKEVEADYQRILERHRNYEYPPEVQAKIRQCRGAAQQRREALHRRGAQETGDAEDHV